MLALESVSIFRRLNLFPLTGIESRYETNKNTTAIMMLRAATTSAVAAAGLGVVIVVVE